IQKREFERRARKMSRMLDVDGDGKVTIAELERQHEKRLALIDANDDGEISAQEMRRAHRFMAPKQMHRGPHPARSHERRGHRCHRDFRRGYDASRQVPADKAAVEKPAEQTTLDKPASKRAFLLARAAYRWCRKCDRSAGPESSMQHCQTVMPA